MNFKQSIAISVLFWPIYIILSLPLLVLGPITVAIALLCKAFKDTKSITNENKDVKIFTWKLMAPWNNLEDGINPSEYQEKYSDRSFLMNAYIWCSFRNPVSGLRWTPFLSVIPDGSKIQYVGSLGQLPLERLSEYEEKKPISFYCWQGIYSNYWKQFIMPFTILLPFTKLGYYKGDLMRFWVGWKLYPDDKNGGPYGYRRLGSGFAAQFKPVQKGDNKN